MSEMLANHYFLIRNFKEACSIYEQIFSQTSMPKNIRKKLIICYVEIMHLKKALSEFYKFINEDINFILNSDIKKEDCPCPEIIPEIENGKLYTNENDKDIALGILWLYCDIYKSEYYFQQYFRRNQNDLIIKQIIELIHKNINQQNGVKL